MQTRSKTRKAVAENPLVSDSLPDDTLVGIQKRSRKRKAVEKPLVYQPFVENVVPCCVQPVVNNSTCRTPTVEKTLTNLPHHIIIDILLRLPAECVFQCQSASKLLEILATTPFFIRTHLARQSTSIIALQSFSQSSDREFKLYFIDEQAKNVEEAKLKLDFCYTVKQNPVMIYDSCDGFLLFKSKDGSRKSIVVIWNPTTKQQVTITRESRKFMVCGFYFNPHNKKYEVLLRYLSHGGRDSSGKYVYDYDILRFGPKFQRKTKLQKNVGRRSYRPRSERPPTIINGTLYWMVDNDFEDPRATCSNSIMTYEIGTNKFSTMPHGGASCDNDNLAIYGHSFMQLIEMEGQLGLCLTKEAYFSNSKIELWVLINPATNSWVITHIVTLPKPYSPSHFSCSPNSLDVEVVKMKDGKLLVRQKSRLLLCDLDLNTHEVVENKGFQDDSFRPVIHTHSLVSLNADKLIQLHSRRS